MPKLDLNALPSETGSGYPAEFDQGFEKRHTTRLTNPGGITQFGVNHVRLEPGAKSSLRHWHEEQDEFLVVTEGQLTLVDDHGDTPLSPGDCCAFPKGDGNGHCIANHSDTDGAFIVVGTRTPTETAHYPDIDLKYVQGSDGYSFTRKDGSPMPEETT